MLISCLLNTFSAAILWFFCIPRVPHSALLLLCPHSVLPTESHAYAYAICDKRVLRFGKAAAAQAGDFYHFENVCLYGKEADWGWGNARVTDVIENRNGMLLSCFRSSI